jgi:anti-sigma28 factor (negative regulator of flagellin synthesis)
MKIYDINTTGTPAAETSRRQESQRIGSGTVTGTGKAGRSSGDHVELSDTVNSLSRAISTYNGNQASRVQALATQYRSGNYQVNSAAVSRAMVADASSQGGR